MTSSSYGQSHNLLYSLASPEESEFGRPSAILRRRPLETLKSTPKSSLPDAQRGRQFIGPNGSGGKTLYPCCSMEDVAMRTTFDFSPLFRSSVGFDRLVNALEAASRVESIDN